MVTQNLIVAAAQIAGHLAGAKYAAGLLATDTMVEIAQLSVKLAKEIEKEAQKG
jgi:hypothetical protein